MTRPDVRTRFDAQVSKSEGCWLWGGAKRLGYGRIRVNGKKVTASRLAYEIHFGPIPAGMLVCHRCDNPSCVRPDHLFLGTHAENVRDMVSKRRHIDGKRRGQENGNAKLTEAQVLSIRSDLRTQSAIAREYGVGQALVSKIKLGKLWRSLNA